MRPKTHRPDATASLALSLEPPPGATSPSPIIPSLEALRREAGLPPQPPAEPGPARRAWFAADLELQRRRNAMERQARDGLVPDTVKNGPDLRSGQPAAADTDPSRFSRGAHVRP